ncbi:hypothetical protein H0I54_13465 [Yersinia kristensenii]|uniref:hypothetical protein n=1 Tax=Yersinia kristensenii TaxID=28152 RepID=UPI000B680665|nr:hypothetical protein [Yersinia kristensenii]MBW5812780.1 hypothetical protein [Yersinia kristensenii]MBW5817128.1 hypothetical protein [Yersinia kristensenii]MBW5829919.1 hypothetical protein [Yersinia kristensenii]MBW5842821.1 hypothetical protein [Yersinia kristensenii]MDA5489240.1 hypothetical protein [Yersinia kristensenii]
MTMADFRRMAAKMDQHMQQLDAQGVTEPHPIINRMMGYTPELHQIWTDTTDKELIALTQEYPGFYRYALIMETAFEQESQKSSRSYVHHLIISSFSNHSNISILGIFLSACSK